MTPKLYSISEFLTIREKCFFCQKKLRPLIINFTGRQQKELPLINATLNENKFVFPLEHTTADYSIGMITTIEVSNNNLIFETVQNSFISTTPMTDQLLAGSTLRDFDVHLELYCSNKNCRMRYYLSSDILTFHFHDSKLFWVISPVQLFLESFRLNDLIINNDHSSQTTYIYSKGDDYTSPIKLPLIDFNLFGPDKLLNRIQTLVIFN